MRKCHNIFGLTSNIRRHQLTHPPKNSYSHFLSDSLSLRTSPIARNVKKSGRRSFNIAGSAGVKIMRKETDEIFCPPSGSCAFDVLCKAVPEIRERFALLPEKTRADYFTSFRYRTNKSTITKLISEIGMQMTDIPRMYELTFGNDLTKPTITPLFRLTQPAKQYRGLQQNLGAIFLVPVVGKSTDSLESHAMIQKTSDFHTIWYKLPFRKKKFSFSPSLVEEPELYDTNSMNLSLYKPDKNLFSNIPGDNTCCEHYTVSYDMETHVVPIEQAKGRELPENILQDIINNEKAGYSTKCLRR